MVDVERARLEAAFHEQMLNIYRRAKKEAGYNATRFLQMVDSQRGLGAAQSLLSSPTVSEGFTQLWMRRRLDLTVEALVLTAPWTTLFTPEERAIALDRLRQLGFEPPSHSPPLTH